MAIFYDRIKGVPAGSEDTKETTIKEIVFTGSGVQIKGQTHSIGQIIGNSGLDITAGAIKMGPEGKFFEVSSSGVYVNVPLETKNDINIKNAKGDNITTFSSASGEEKWDIGCEVNIKDMLNVCNADGTESYFVVATTENGDPFIKGGVNTTIAATLTVDGSITGNNGLKIKGESTFTSGINASWFNATSDSRAKENIKSRNVENFLVLEDLSKWSIYSFNYKNDPKKETQIGIIAQEHLASTNKLGFEIVANREATGEKDDFMSVKESKIPYLTVQAIQALNEMRKVDEKQIMALQKENSQLKSQINDLQVQISTLAETIKKRLN